MVRLVKGAYWDTEIKAAQVAGLPDYPVFTRKVATDVSYLACAKKLLAASDVIYPGVRDPQRQHASARSRRWPARRRSSSSGCTAWARGCTRSWPSSRRIGEGELLWQAAGGEWIYPAFATHNANTIAR